MANPAKALSPDKALSQYIHDAWGTEQGFPGGRVYAIAQTPDGYLWIGTATGLIRFDGLSFRLVQSTDSAAAPIGPVLGLAVDAEGDLWVRPQGPRLIRYHDGIFQDVLQNPALPEEANVTAMCVARNGEILFSEFANGTFRYSNGRLIRLAAAADLPKLVISLAETADGKVWMGTREQGLYVVTGDGTVSIVSKGLPDKKINAVLPVGSDELWVGSDNGVARWNGKEFSPSTASRTSEHTQAFAMIRDRDSNVWVGTSSGLVRITPKGLTSTQQSDNGSQAVTALFEDREGNLWVGTAQGIERFRESPFTTYSVTSGLPFQSYGPVYVDPEGRVWLASSESHGLYWMEDGSVGHVKDTKLDNDVVYSIDGREGELWIGRQRGGLTHVVYKGDSLQTKTYTRAEGLAENSVYAVHENRDGTVWAGTLSAGLSRFKNGNFTTYTTANGLASNTISSITEASDGTLWVGSPNGVNALSNGQWHLYSSREGLPPGNVNCLFQDSSGTLWIGTANGLGFITSGNVQTVEVPELNESIFGLAEDKTGSLWIATSNHILRVDREKTLRQVRDSSAALEYGLADGLLSTQGVNRVRSIVRDSSGKIWLSTTRGLSFVDPKPMSFSSAPALVHIEGIFANGRSVNTEEHLRIPAPHQRITVSYTGLSLSVPARVRFKYRLDGFDQEWSEATANREAVYTNLNPGSYCFRVIASNSEGLWNSAESTLPFEIEPAFWRTWWFRVASLAVLAAAVLLFVRLRVVRLSNQLNVRFEERLAERTRIAQELHDTLLQGLLSASMQLHVANDRLAGDSPAKPLVARVLELMGRVIEEGRNAVRGLRSSKTASNLQEAFAEVRQEFPVEPHVGFRVIVEGTPRRLRPMIGDEVYRIGREALSNAFQHSRASDIEVELEYAPSYLRVFVRDNGAGIDPQVLKSGRDGHWGLSGMKERSEKIGGTLRVLSHAEAGTEVELSVPGPIAFELRPEDRSSRWFSRLGP
jgi:ligand-binding sensor domain-containing protein/signal transduction histidine kinase